MTERVLLIDADVIAFRNAAAIEKRTIKATNLKSGNTKDFKNRTELKKFVTDKGFEYDKDAYLIEDVVSAQDSKVLPKTMTQTIDKIREFTWADKIELHLGTSNITIRETLDLPRPYKDRNASSKPVHLAEAKRWLSKNFPTVIADGIEADDTLTIRAYEELDKGNYPIIATIDKDAWQSQGCATLNLLDNPYTILEIPEVGELHPAKDTYKGTGLKFLCWQLLAGDDVDNYRPYELSSVKYGKTSAYKALMDKTTPEEFLVTCINEYKRWYPEIFEYNSHAGKLCTADWEKMLLMYWRCAYMQRSWTDEGNFWMYAGKYGVYRKDHT